MKKNIFHFLSFVSLFILNILKHFLLVSKKKKRICVVPPPGDMQYRICSLHILPNQRSAEKRNKNIYIVYTIRPSHLSSSSDGDGRLYLDFFGVISGARRSTAQQQTPPFHPPN
jgi:hypothetical protein